MQAKLANMHRFLQSNSSPSLYNDQYNLIDDFYYRM